MMLRIAVTTSSRRAHAGSTRRKKWRLLLGWAAPLLVGVALTVGLVAGTSGASATTRGEARFHALNTTWFRAAVAYGHELESKPLSALGPYTQAFTAATFLYVQGMMGLVTPACLQRQLDALVGDTVAVARDIETVVTHLQEGMPPKAGYPVMTAAIAKWGRARAAIDHDVCGSFAL